MTHTIKFKSHSVCSVDSINRSWKSIIRFNLESACKRQKNCLAFEL